MFCLEDIAFLFFIYIFPFFLLVINILLICKKNGKLFKQRREYSKITLVFGGAFFFIELLIMHADGLIESRVSGTEKLLFLQLFVENYPIILFIVQSVSILFLIMLDQPKILSPIGAVLCVSGSYAGFIVLIISFAATIYIALSENDSEYYIVLLFLWLYVVNYFLCQVRILREVIRDYPKYYKYNHI